MPTRPRTRKTETGRKTGIEKRRRRRARTRTGTVIGTEGTRKRRRTGTGTKRKIAPSGTEAWAERELTLKTGCRDLTPLSGQGQATRQWLRPWLQLRSAFLGAFWTEALSSIPLPTLPLLLSLRESAEATRNCLVIVAGSALPIAGGQPRVRHVCQSTLQEGAVTCARPGGGGHSSECVDGS